MPHRSACVKLQVCGLWLFSSRPPSQLGASIRLMHVRRRPGQRLMAQVLERSPCRLRRMGRRRRVRHRPATPPRPVSTSFVTEPTTLVETGPGTCGEVGYAWGPCGPAWSCEPGTTCWPTAAGNFCSPDCNFMPMAIECETCPADVGLFTPACEPLQSVCFTTCVDSIECLPGQLCDLSGGPGVCVWPSDCGPKLDNGGPWQPCSNSMECSMNTACVGGSTNAWGICAPTCNADDSPCETPTLCGALITKPAVLCNGIRGNKICQLPCFTSWDCAPGMVCGNGTCTWPMQ